MERPARSIIVSGTFVVAMAAWFWFVATAPSTVIEIPPGQEQRALALFLPWTLGDSAGDGWVFEDLKLERSALRAMFGSGETKLIIKLQPRGMDAQGPVVSTPSFAIFGTLRGATESDAAAFLARAVAVVRANDAGDWFAPYRATASPESQGTQKEQLIRVEQWLTALFLAFAMVTLLRDPLWRTEWKSVLALFAVAVTARSLVPWVPANYYSDLATPYPNFRFNVEYRQPLYDALWSVTSRPDAPFWINVILGSLVPALFPLVWPRTHPIGRYVKPFALAVALLPLEVRLSASETVHVYGLFLWTLGAYLFENGRASGKVRYLWGAGVGAFLLAATRKELTLGPVLYLLLSLGLMPVTWREALQVAPVVLGMAGGFFESVLGRYGMINTAPQLSLANVQNYFASLPGFIVWTGATTPRSLTLGVLAAVAWAFRRNRRWLMVYFLGMAVLTAPYLLENHISGDIAGSVHIASTGRYAAIWVLLPTLFGVVGLAELFWWSPSRALRAACVVAVAALWSNVLPAYTMLLPYQAEFLYLKEYLAQERDPVTIEAGWRKGVDYDFCDSLALPFFALAKPGQEIGWLISDGNEFARASTTLPAKHVYFRNALAQVAANVDSLPPETRRVLTAYDMLSEQARSDGSPIYEWPPRRVQALTFEYGSNHTLLLETFLVRKRVHAESEEKQAIRAEAHP